MRLIVAFLFGVSAALNGLFLTGYAGFGRSTVLPSFEERRNHEVIEKMKTNRIITTLALLSVLAGAPALAQEDTNYAQPGHAARMNSTVESLFHDNIKTVAGSGSQALAVSNAQSSQLLARMQNQSLDHANRVNILAERALGQAVVVSPTEGSKAVETIQESGDAANTAQALALLSAFLNSRVNEPSQ